MSGYNIYVWDADQTANTNPVANGIFHPENIPAHDTGADNYTAFLTTINDFITEAQAQYPDMDYGGHHLFDTHISIEPIPHDILTVYNALILETALHNDLCVFDPLSNTLDTPADKTHYKLGTANTQWQHQKQADADRQALLDSDDEALPSNAKEMNQLINNIFKERLKQAGIKGVKKDKDGYLVANFEETQIKFSVDIHPHEYVVNAYIYICPKLLTEYIRAVGMSRSKTIIDFAEAYNIPDAELSDFVDEGNYQIQDKSKLRYEINRAVDLFIDAYPHVQTLSDLYKYSLNTHNDSRLQRKKVGSRLYNPIPFEFILLMARLSEQPNYEQIKADLITQWIEWNVDKYHFSKKKWEETEQEIAQRNPDYEIYPFNDEIEGDVAEEMQRRINEWIVKLESYSVEDALKEG